MLTENKQQNIVPELRFSSFNEQWNEVIFSDVVKLTDCKHRTPEYVAEGIPLVSPGVLSWGFLDIEQSRKRVAQKEYLSLMDHCSPTIGDLVFGRNQSLGVASIIKDKKPFVLGQDTVLLQYYSESAKIFLFYMIETEWFQNEIYKKSGGSTFGRINISDIKKLTFCTPNETEQQKIADFLRSVDGWLDNLRGQKTALETYKQGMMQKLFSQQIRFKDENGKNFPEWEETSLGTIVTFLSDYTANGSFGALKDNVQYYNTENYAALVRTTDLKKRNFIPERFTDKRGYDFLKKTSLHGGELIMANVGNIGEVFLAPTNYIGKMTLAPNTYMFKLNSETSKEYIYQWMLTPEFKNKVARMVGGGGLKAINKTSFRSIKLHVPYLEEQQKIVDFLFSIDKGMESKQQQIAKAEEWKKGLMQKMFV